MNTEILFIGDRSGSMSRLRDDVIGGFNTFIEGQRNVKGECRVTYTQFDDVYERVYEGLSIGLVPPLTHETYQPRGSTALLDAIGRTLAEQGERIAQQKWAELVIVVIATDGMENASVEFSRDRVTRMIRHAETHGWKFIFLAAGLDAFSEAGKLGVNPQFARVFDKSANGVQESYLYASNATRSLRTEGDVQPMTVPPGLFVPADVQQQAPAKVVMREPYFNAPDSNSMGG